MFLQIEPQIWIWPRLEWWFLWRFCIFTARILSFYQNYWLKLNQTYCFSDDMFKAWKGDPSSRRHPWLACLCNLSDYLLWFPTLNYGGISGFSLSFILLFFNLLSKIFFKTYFWTPTNEALFKLVHFIWFVVFWGAKLVGLCTKYRFI